MVVLVIMFVRCVSYNNSSLIQKCTNSLCSQCLVSVAIVEMVGVGLWIRLYERTGRLGGITGQLRLSSLRGTQTTIHQSTKGWGHQKRQKNRGTTQKEILVLKIN